MHFLILSYDIRKTCPVGWYYCLNTSLSWCRELLTVSYSSTILGCISCFQLSFSIERYTCFTCVRGIRIAILIAFVQVLLNDSSSLRHNSLLPSSKKRTNFALTWIGEELLNKRWTLEEPLLSALHLCLLCLLTFDVDSLPSRFEETKSAKV